MGDWVTVCRADEIAPGQGKQVEVGGRAIAVFNVDGTYYAIGGECTHQGGPLGEGELNGTTVTCPWHAAEFDVTTGKALALPATEDVPVYRTAVEGGEVRVELP
jgi:nitrite reductase/ring-hydroxylating ferredoxin subunit